MIDVPCRCCYYLPPATDTMTVRRCTNGLKARIAHRPDEFPLSARSVRRNRHIWWEGYTVRKLIYSMNTTLDGYIAAYGDDIGWGVPSAELHQWFNDRARERSVSRCTAASCGK